MRLEHVENWWEDFKTWILSYRLKANGFDANNQTVDNVATALESHQAPPLGQVMSLVQTAQLAGELKGATYNVSGTAKIFRDSNSDGESEELSSAVPGLYFVGDVSGVVLNTVSFPSGAVIRYTDANTWFLDSDNGTLGTFDPTAAYANPGGTRSRIGYRFLTKSYPGHSIPNSDTEGWTAGQDIVWNSAYDTTGDNNAGRWEKDYKPAVPLGTDLIAGIWKRLKGFKNLTGELEADIDEDNGLSWNGNKFRVNVLSSIFSFVGGALKIIDGAITRAMLAAAVTTELDGKLSIEQFTRRSKAILRIVGSITWNGSELTALVAFNPVGPGGSTIVKSIVAQTVGAYHVLYFRPTDAQFNVVGDYEVTPVSQFITDYVAQKNDLIIGYRDGITSKFFFANGRTFTPDGSEEVGAHTQAISTITGLQAAIDAKAPLSHTHTASDVTDFQAVVSANTDVTANTTARHAHSNQAALDNVSGTNTGDQDLSDYATISHNHDARYARTTRTRTDTISSYTSGDITGAALDPAPAAGTPVFLDYHRGVPFKSGDGYFSINGSNQPVLSRTAIWFTPKNGDVLKYRWES